jgi:DNA-binding response OmpR family regulator
MTCVMIIDDDPALVMMLQKGLEIMGGYTVLGASDGESGLDMVIKHRPDCVVLDILLPGLDGFQIIRALRGDPQTADIPIIILSALAPESHSLKGMMSGADDYLCKPAYLPDVLASIGRALLLQRAQDILQSREPKD